MRRIVGSIFCISLALLMVTGCTKQPAPHTPSTPSRGTTQSAPAIHHIKTTVVGLDQYTDDQVLVINTTDGPFIVGPEVANGVKQHIFTALTQEREQQIFIHYKEQPPTTQTIAHRRVTGLIVNEQTFLLK